MYTRAFAVAMGLALAIAAQPVMTEARPAGRRVKAPSRSGHKRTVRPRPKRSRSAKPASTLSATRGSRARASGSRTGPRRVVGDRAAAKIARNYRATFLLIGNGSKTQYRSMADVRRAIDPVARRLDTKYGRGNWLVTFGGDPYSAKTRDIAHVVKYLKDAYGAPIMAFQSDIVAKKWGGVDRHIDFVRYLRTDYSEARAGSERQVLWGGFHRGKPVGATKGYLGGSFRKQLTGVVAVGGGPIALAEARHAHKQGVPITYVATRSRHPDSHGQYGPLHAWAKQVSVSP